MGRPTPTATPPSTPLAPSLREFLGLVREDLAANGHDRHQPGFRALFVYRFGVYSTTIKTPVIRQAFSILYRRMQRRVRNRLSIELARTAHIGRRVRIIHQGAIVIHPFAVIGDDCWIRQGVTLGTGVDWHEDDRPTLGRDVRIGVGAVLAGTLTVGDGARIGPNAVVMTDVPAGAKVVAPRPRLFPV